jgi:GNAT superfamily N-acetyltransferase
VICRAARHEDVPALAEQAVEAYRNVFAPLIPEINLSEFDLAHFTARFTHHWPTMRVVEHEGVPIAFAMLTQDHVDMFFVAGDMRGRGVGQMLLADVVEQGARTLETFAANSGARRFYQRLGWRHLATATRPFGGTSCDFVSYCAPGIS